MLDLHIILYWKMEQSQQWVGTTGDAVQQKLVAVTQSCEDGVCCEIRFSIDQCLFKKHLMGKHNGASYTFNWNCW